MVGPRRCTATTESGEPCRQAPLVEGSLCYWHSPDTASEAAEARRLGGLRRRREHTLAAAYAVEGLDSVASLRRLLQVAVLDCLGLETSIARVRTLAYLCMVGVKLLEVGEHEERLAALEAAVRGQPGYADSIIDAVAEEEEVEFEAVTDEAPPEERA